MADFQQNFLSSLAGGLQIGQQIKQQRDTSQINRLAGLAYGTDPGQRESFIGQMHQINPAMAAEQEKSMAMTDERRQKGLINAARILVNTPEQFRAGQYARMVPGLSQYGLSSLPPEYNAETSDLIMQTAQGLVRAADGAAGTPTDVRSFQMMTAGLSPEDRERARRINLGLDGRASSSGFSQVKFTGADGRERIGVLNGKTGQIDLPDGTSFNPQTGAISQTQGEQPAAPQSGGQHFGAFTSLAGEFPGVAMTSGVRTAERNQQVGGAANSQHLTGTAADYSVPPQLKPAFIARAKQLGYQAIDEGDHIHLQLPRGGGGAGGPGVFVGRAPEDQAAATERAKQEVQLQYLPAELNARTDAAIRQARGTEMAKTEAEREAQAPKRIKQYEQAIGAAGSVMTSLDNAIKLIGPTTTGWGGARLRSIEGTDAYNLAAEIETIKANLGFDRLQQMRDNSPTGGALGAIAVQELVALQSTIANLDPNQSDEQVKQNLERVKKHYEGWVSAVQQALVDERRGSQVQPQATGGQRTIVRTGTANGRKVIQYSDGSVEYGN